MTSRKIGRKHRGLVLGQLEGISSAAFDKYKKVITDTLAHRNGIYALYRNDRLYYVGLATNLKGRINQHLRDRHKGKWTHFSLYLVRSEKNMKDLEALCLRIADPKGNKVRGRLPGATDLRRAFRKHLIEHAQDEIDKLMGDGQRRVGSRKRKRAPRKVAAARKKTGKYIPLKGLLGGKAIRARFKGKVYRAWVYSSGRIKLRLDGKIYNTPSGAGEAVRGRKHTNGWTFWRYQKGKGEWELLKTLRQ